MYIIYALVFIDNRIYVGMTNDLERRTKEHIRGKTKSTKNRSIRKIIIIEKCKSRLLAREKEKYWKSGFGKEKLKSRMISSVG
jgi:putative endonuclease